MYVQGASFQGEAKTILFISIVCDSYKAHNILFYYFYNIYIDIYFIIFINKYVLLLLFNIMHINMHQILKRTYGRRQHRMAAVLSLPRWEAQGPDCQEGKGGT